MSVESPPAPTIGSSSNAAAGGAVDRWQTRLWQRMVLGAFIAAARLIQKSSRSASLRFGRNLGSAAYRLDKRRRRYAERNLRLAYGSDYSDVQRDAMNLRSFQHWGKCTTEFLRAPRLGKREMEELVSAIEGREYLDQVRVAGTGFILITGHLGNFEFMGRWLASQGVPSTVVAREPGDPAFAAYLREMREYGGNVALPKGTTSARELLAILKRKQVLTLGIDQSSGDVFVPFFGVPAGTVAGPALLALRTGVPLLPAFCVWEPDDTYRIIFLPPLEASATGNKDADIARTMGVATMALESVIRRFPDQWLWMHHRWKSAFEEVNRARWPGGFDVDQAWQRWTGGANVPRPVPRPERAKLTSSERKPS